MHVQRNTEARSFNDSCCAKAVNIAYYGRVSVVLGTQREMRMRHIIICGQAGATIFYGLISYV
jgi:hypothetical protein